jgi:predicted ribosome quality control (RQC) complex YloA/Tae2 family protein
MRRMHVQVKAVAAVQQLRKPAWFEKFNWFVTSENYLVVSGRDAQQNELLVKRYMRKDDLYVHAELHGASTNIIRNHNPDRPGMAQSPQKFATSGPDGGGFITCSCD